MSDVSIEINLHGGEPVLDMRRYRPGEVVSGDVVIYPNKEIDARHIYIRLLWHTAGRGTKFEQKEEELDVYQGTLMAGMPSNYSFQFTIPEQPWSYEGHYIKVIWKVEVSIDLSWARDPNQEQMILVEPDRAGVTSNDDGYSSFY